MGCSSSTLAGDPGTQTKDHPRSIKVHPAPAPKPLKVAGVPEKIATVHAEEQLKLTPEYICVVEAQTAESPKQLAAQADPAEGARETELTKQELLSLRDRVRERIVAANVTGELGQALQEMPVEGPSPAQAAEQSKTPQQPDNVELLAEEADPAEGARETELTKQDLLSLRDRVRERIVAANATGELGQALQVMPVEGPIPVSFNQPTLQDGAAKGEPRKVANAVVGARTAEQSKTPQQPDNEELLAGEADPTEGARETELTKQDLLSLRDRVRERIVAANATGELGQALQEVPVEGPSPVSFNQRTLQDENVVAPVQHDNPERADARGIIVWRAKGLHNANFVGQSDPYCIGRVGPAGSAWQEKAHSNGSRSEVVCGARDPEWRMGFVVEVVGMKDPELQIRIYDKDFCQEDDFLGEASMPLDSNLDHATLPLSNGAGCVEVSTGSVRILEEHQIGPSAFFEAMAPIGNVKTCKVEDVTGKGPLRLGVAPLPPQCRGIFWLSDQGTNSALITFGGPSNDGGGCSAGDFQGNRYRLRLNGDRTWASVQDPKEQTQILDLVYHFAVDHAPNPKRLQIYPEARHFGLALTQESIMDLEVQLLEEGDEAYPGSIVWRRKSWTAGIQSTRLGDWKFVQVIDEHGERIPPAWGKFVEYQNSFSESPGLIWYHEIVSS